MQKKLPDLSTDLEAFLPKQLPSDPRQRTQLHREFDARVRAFTKHHQSWQKAVADGDPLRMKAARRLAQHWTGPIAAYIQAEADRLKRKRGPRNRWLAAYDVLGADSLASHTVSALVSLLLGRTNVEAGDRRVTASDASRAIGNRIATACRIAEWEQRNPALFAAYERRLDEAGATLRHREEVLKIGLSKKARDPERATPEFLEATAPWSNHEIMRMGRWLLFVAEKATKGAISLHRRREGKGRITAAPYHVELNPDAIEWLAKAIDTAALRAGADQAMVCEPRPWKGARGGGYLLGDDLRDANGNTHLIRALPLVRRSIEAALTTLEGEKSAQPVLSAINGLQAVPFAINEGVLDTASQAMEARLNLHGLPHSYRRERPPRPAEADEIDTALHKEWRRQAAAVERENARLLSKAMQAEAAMAEAAELRSLEIEGVVANGPFYFAHYLDFRGRMYASGKALNPQGNDLSRSLIRFHNGKPIGNGSGPRWLAAQVAKAFGKDKLPWPDRVQWTEANEAMLRRITEDPLGNRQEWEGEADKLWSALAAAREWIAYLDSGRSPEFVTTLPIFIDGTCNGLQHFAALSRDPDLARLVNLAPSDSPQDIYQDVAEAALQDIQHKAKHGAHRRRREERARAHGGRDHGQGPRREGDGQPNPRG
jgi:DNA-directed RNA polymerase, mitochondrial